MWRRRLRDKTNRAHRRSPPEQGRQGVGAGGEIALQRRMGIQGVVGMSGQRRHLQLLELRFLETLRLGPPVLEPDFHLEQKKR